MRIRKSTSLLTQMILIQIAYNIYFKPITFQHFQIKYLLKDII